jgi:hypothetical protein
MFGILSFIIITFFSGFGIPMEELLRGRATVHALFPGPDLHFRV